MNTIQTKDKTHWLAHGKLSCMAAAAGLAFSAFQDSPHLSLVVVQDHNLLWFKKTWLALVLP